MLSPEKIWQEYLTDLSTSHGDVVYIVSSAEIKKIKSRAHYARNTHGANYHDEQIQLITDYYHIIS